MKNTCKNCKWYSKEGLRDILVQYQNGPSRQLIEEGACHKNLPISDRFPKVSHNDYCGEFKKKTLTPPQGDK